MAAYSTANDPIMQRYIELLQTNPALAQQIDERTAELFGQPELNVYNRGLRNVVTPEGGGADAAYREVPRATALRTAIEELDVPGAAATPPVEPTAPAATNGADLAAVDERLRTLNELTGADIPVMRDRTPTGRTTPTGLTDDELRQQMESQFTGFDAFFHGADTAADDAAKAKADQARQKQSKMGRGRFTLDQPERPDEEWKLSPLPDTPSRESRPLGFMRPFPTTPPTQQVEETVEEAPAPAAKPVVETQETPQEDAPAGSILSRIGRYAKENPDIALAGMEGIGNLLANIGAARGQRKADEATQQGMARSNLISALTGGRVRPAVAEETPEMGLLGRVGQAVGTAGKLGREVEQERAERGFEQQEADRKAADLDRKIADDARKLQDLIRKEKYTDAQIENFLARNTLGMEKNEIARYRAEVYDRLGTGRLDLAEREFEQDLIEFDFFKQMESRGMDVKEAALKIDKDKMKLAWQGAQREYEMQMKKFGLDVKRVEALEKDVETRAKRAASYAEQVALNTMTARGEQKREVRKIIDGLDGKQLNRMMDPKQGTAAIMQGLNAAYRDFQVDPNQANMNAVFQMYQRLFDPATVREGDLAIQREGQGEILRAIASMERLSGGGFVIARSVIEDMREIADRYAESARKSATNTLNNYIKNAVLGTDPTPLETAQAEAIRNYYTSIWSYDPLKDQTVSGTAGNTGDAAQTGETGDVADAWVEGLE